MVYSTQALDETFFALSDPTRRAMVALLAGGDRTIKELASGFAMSLPAASKHLHVLARAGLATIERDGRARRARLRAERMRPALEWIERYRRFWESELDQLATYLESTESTWKAKQQEAAPFSKSGVRSARRGKKSSTRGRTRKK